MKKFRWSKVYESTEEELVAFLDARNIASTHWIAETFVESDEIENSYDVTLWCAEGSFSLLASNGSISMQPGDGVIVPASTIYSTRAGISGCICYETK